MIKTITSILRLLQTNERKLFILFTTANVFINLADVLVLAGMVWLAGFYIGNTDAPFLPSWLIANKGIWLLAAFATTIIIKMILAVIVTKKQFHLCYSIATRLSEHQIKRFYNIDFSAQVNTDSSIFARRISVLPMQFAQYSLLGIQDLIIQATMIFCVTLAILVLQPVVFPFVLLVLLPLLTISLSIIKRKTNSLRTTVVKHHEKSLQKLYEALKGYVEANIYFKKDFFTRRYIHEQSKLNNSNASFGVLQSLPARIIEAFAIVGLLVLIALSSFSGTSMIITLGAFIAAAYKLIPGTSKLINLWSQISSFQTSLVELENLLVKDVSKESQAELKHIQLQDVSFGFNGDSIFKQFNGEFRSGDFRILKASSGKGKTTLVNLLLGFLEESEGKVIYNGKCTQPAERKQYWPNISYIKQESFLIYDSIAKNITLEEEYDAEKLGKVIGITGLQPFIATLPGGIQYPITENGKNISGGQKQRIAIARALYKEPDVFILDEPFNELDDESEQKLLAHFKQLSESGKIVLLITHNQHVLDSSKEVLELR